MSHRGSDLCGSKFLGLNFVFRTIFFLYISRYIIGILDSKYKLIVFSFSYFFLVGYDYISIVIGDANN